MGGELFINVVREFADSILAAARPEGSPLFMDRLDEGKHSQGYQLLTSANRNFSLSNLAVQQHLIRMLVGLTQLTGDEKYQMAARDAIAFAFQNFSDSAGLLLWGGHGAIALPIHEVAFESAKGLRHELKCVYPYYEFMWQVNAQATQRFIEAFWNAHLIDWGRLDFSRHGYYQTPVGQVWDSDYSPGPVFFWGRGLTFVNTGSDLYYSAAELTRLSGLPRPLIWAKRLAGRYIETRQHPVGISGYQFSQCEKSQCDGPEICGDRAQYQYAPYIPEGHLVYESTLFKPRPVVQRCQLHIAETLNGQSGEFLQWASEELTAWARIAYRRRDNSFLPMLTDGYSLEGFVIQRDGYFGPRGRIEKAIFADADFLWAYTHAYRLVKNELFWSMIRCMAAANGLGDVGKLPGLRVALERKYPIADYRFIYCMLNIHRATGNPVYLQAAADVAETIIHNCFREGWFISSEGRSVNRPETLAILQLGAALLGKEAAVPQSFC
jgi:pectate lyase